MRKREFESVYDVHPFDPLDEAKPHWGGTAAVSAYVAAAAAAAAAAQAAAQKSAQKRQAANQAMAAKQGSGMSSGPATSVAGEMLGTAGGMLPRIKDMIQGGSKPVAGAVDSGIPDSQPGAQPGQDAMPSIPQGQNMSAMLGQPAPILGQQNQMGLQQALGGQQPDYAQWMQQFGMQNGGM
jgi:hypothetical protein